MTQPQRPRPTRTAVHTQRNAAGDRLQQVVYIVTSRGHRLALSSSVHLWAWGYDLMLRFDGEPVYVAGFASTDAATEALDELWAEILAPSGRVLDYRGINQGDTP